MTASQQTMADVLIAELDRLWDEARAQMRDGMNTTAQQGRIGPLLNRLHEVDPMACRRWERGRQGEWKQLWWAFTGSRSRSAAYEWDRTVQLATVLEKADLIDGHWYTDRQTGRKVKTLVRELGRLNWDLTTEAGRELLIDGYRALRDRPLPVIKELIREASQEAHMAR